MIRLIQIGASGYTVSLNQDRATGWHQWPDSSVSTVLGAEGVPYEVQLARHT